MKQGIERQYINAWFKHKKMNRYILEPCHLKEWVWKDTKGMGTDQALLLDLFKNKRNSWSWVKFVQEVDSGGDPLTMQCEREI